jgi:hypothetical protein
MKQLTFLERFFPAFLQMYLHIPVQYCVVCTPLTLFVCTLFSCFPTHAALLQVYTREYVSPEVVQAVVGGVVSIVAQPSWDLWGIGIIMWELATGGRLHCNIQP